MCRSENSYAATCTVDKALAMTEQGQVCVCHCECQTGDKESGSYSLSGIFASCNSPPVSSIITKNSEPLETQTESPKSKPYIEIREWLLWIFLLPLTLRCMMQLQ